MVTLSLHCVTVLLPKYTKSLETRHACETGYPVTKMPEVNVTEFQGLFSRLKDFILLYQEGLLRTDSLDRILIGTTEFLVLWCDKVESTEELPHPNPLWVTIPSDGHTSCK